MVERQLRGRGIGDEAVLTAMATVPRERFVPPEMRSDAYRDDALPIASGQSISQPYMVARMTELLAPRPGMRVLEGGHGLRVSGRGAGADRLHGNLRGADPALADAARARIEAAGMADRIRIVIGDGSIGLPEDAPFHGIVVTAAAPAVPEPLPGNSPTAGGSWYRWGRGAVRS